MKSSFWISAMFICSSALFLSCGGAKGVALEKRSDSGDDLVEKGGQALVYDGPAHKFRAAPIEKKDRAYASSRVDFNAIDPLVLRMECFEHLQREVKTPVIQKQSPKGWGRGAGGLGGRKPVEPMVVMSPSRSSADDSLSTSERPSRPRETQPIPQESVAPQADYQSDVQYEQAAEMLVPTHDDKPGYYDWGAEIYLSNDDSMSLSSAQRVIYAIDNFMPIPSAHIRPHELLNYFSFDTAKVEKGHDFSVYPTVFKDERQEGLYKLGLATAGRFIDKNSRRNAALTWVIDRSGSMSAEGRMEYLKKGLKRSLKELKRGDIINVVLFDHEVCVPVENFVMGRDNTRDLERFIDSLRPRGWTDLHAGLVRGYDLADRVYQGHYSNRVLLVTDALANRGETDEDMISVISKYYENRRIRLSGIGVGRDFNDSLLDKLTERGKGAYLFLGSEAEVEAVFGSRFVSLVETAALNVHFKLHLPKSLKMNVFYGEESSTHKEDVQPIHYFANTTQLFLSDLIARQGQLRPQDDIMLSIEYEDPETAQKYLEQYAFNLGQVIENDDYNVRKGHLVITFIDMLAVMSQRKPERMRYSRGGWHDEEAVHMCQEGEEELNYLARGLEDDPETKRVLQLWEKYCSRYDAARAPIKRDGPQKRVPSWPGAQPAPER